MQTMTLEFVNATEAERLGAFALRHNMLGSSTREAHHSPEDLSRDVRHLVVLSGDSVIGYGKLIVDGELGRIRQICVSDDVRRGGVGSRILQRLLLQARKERVRTVWLLARFTALGFYRNFGFVEIGPVVPAEDSAAPHRRMELQLPL